MNQHSGVLRVNLSAIRHNWQALRSCFSGSDCGAVLKANAYGLGVRAVSLSLFKEGCRSFYVATIVEGVELRGILPVDADILVLQGCRAGEESACIKYKLVPVVISIDMYERWRKFASGLPSTARVRCALKVNTGMNRLGMSLGELKQIALQKEGLLQSGVELLVSHLACANDPNHELNQFQLQQFESALRALKVSIPSLRCSLANTAGVFLGDAWHFDAARPGIGLFGVNDGVGGSLSLRSVVSVFLPIIQIRSLSKGDTVGYGGAFRAPRAMRIAIVSGGYGDGLMRSLSGLASGWLCESLPLLGFVSMDSCVFDVTDLVDAPKVGDMIELVGEHCALDTVAAQAGTIPYELLTRLGGRLETQYYE